MILLCYDKVIYEVIQCFEYQLLEEILIEYKEKYKPLCTKLDKFQYSYLISRRYCQEGRYLF